jgi:hypothetical protein
MAYKDPKTLTDQELQEALKKNKAAYTVMSVIVSLLVGVAAYSTLKKGFSFFSVYPLIFAPIVISRYKQYKEVLNEINERNKI